jgi:hypothetical protein
MNNEPVAWMYERPNGSAKLTFVREPMAGTVVTETPLYTHPAETITLAELRKTELYRTEQTRSLREFLEPKELTDEEIFKTYLEKYDGHMGFLSPDEVKEFARAILRKAQEK